MKLTQLIPFALLAFTPLALAVPFWNSNGTGGGDWGNSASWTPSGVPDTYAVPVLPEDQDVNINTGDTIDYRAETTTPPTTPITNYAPTLVTPPPTSITAFADSIANPGVETDVASVGHGMITGETVTISGTTNYDGTYTVTVIDADNFTIPVVFVADDATGSAQGPDDAVITVTSTAHGLTNGDTVAISGATEPTYNGSFLVANVTANTFEISVTPVPGAPGDGDAQAPNIVGPPPSSLPDLGLGAGGFAISNGNVVTVAGGTLAQTTMPNEMRIGEGSAAILLPGGSGVGAMYVNSGGTVDTGAALALVVGSDFTSVGAGDGFLSIDDGTVFLGAGAALGGFGVGTDFSLGAVNVGDGVISAPVAVVNYTGTLVTPPSSGITSYAPTLVTPPPTAITAFADNGGVATDVASAGHGMMTGESVTISGTTNYNGVHVVTVIDANNFTIPVLFLGDDATGSAQGPDDAVSPLIVTSSGHGRTTGQTVVITGSTNYDGPHVVTVVDVDTFTIPTAFIANSMAGNAQGPDYGITPVNVEATGHGLTTGQTVVISGYGGDPTYNGSHVVTVIDPDNFTIPINYVDNDATKGSAQTPAGTAVLDLATNNIQSGIGFDNPLTGAPDPGTGSLTVFSDGTVNFGSADVNVGEGGGNGTMIVNAGGTVNGGTGAIIVGDGTGSVGAFSSAGVVNTSGDVLAGRSGSIGNSVAVTGGSASIRTFVVGRSGGSATATVDASTLTLKNIAGVGQSMVGDDAGSVGSVSVGAGGLLDGQSHQDFQVGHEGGTGTLNVTGGGQMNHNWWLNIARSGGSSGTVLVDGAGSKILLDGGGDIHMNVGEDGTGLMTISNGGIVDHDNADPYRTFVGRNNGSNGTLNVQSNGALYTTEFFAGTGNGGNGLVNINSGGLVTADQWMAIGQGVGSVGVVNIDGAGSKLRHYADLRGRNSGGGGDNQVGQDGGTGTINVTNGGTLELGWWLNIARAPGSTGHVNADGGNILMDVTGTIGGGGPRVNVGEDGVGTMDLINNSLLQVGTNAYAGGNGGREFYVGRNSGSNGLLNVNTNSEIHANGDWAFIIGQSGTGVVNVDDGGKIFSNNWLVIGNEAGSVGTLNINETNSGGSLVDAGGPTTNEGRVIVGRIGQATLNQSAGIVRADNWIAIGLDTPGEGTYNLNGGSIHSVEPNAGDRNIIVGNNGKGTLNINIGDPTLNPVVISNGGLDLTWAPTGGNGTINYFNVAGSDGGRGTVNIDLPNGTDIIQTRELYAGWNGNAGLAVADTNGTININKGTLVTNEWVEIGRGGPNAGGTGTVNVNGPDSRWERGTVGIGVVKDMNISTGDGAQRGEGFLNVTGGGTVNQNWWINLARQTNAVGHVTVSDPGSTINMVDAHLQPHPIDPNRGGDGNSQLNVGESGTGTLDILNEGVFNHNMDHGGGEVWIARNGGSKGTMIVDGSGSAFNSKGREFRIGNDTNNGAVLNIQNGGVVNFTSTNEAGAIVNGNFGMAQNNGATGVINMDGGQLNIAAWSLFGAWEDNAGASVATINMINSSLNITEAVPGEQGRLLWGRRGTATINQDGGSFYAQDWAVLGVEDGGRGYWNMSNGATAQLDNELVLGHGGPTAIGAVSIDSSIMTVNGWTNLGRDGAGTGTINVSNTGQFRHLIPNSGDMLIGWNNGIGNVNIDNGTMYQSWWTRLGLDPGSSGNMLIDNGGTFIGGLRVADGFTAVEKGGGHFRIGENGTGSATVQNGSLLYHQGTEFRIATDNGVGTLNIDGSVVDFRSMNDDGTLAGGNFGLAENNGTATLNMTGGLLNVSGWSLFAGWNQVTSKATINMTDSIINLGAPAVPGGWGEGHLFFGDVGTFASGGGSTLNQEGGTIAASGWSAIGRERGGDSLYNLGVNGGGGVMTVGGPGGNELYVGRQSHGTINMGPGTSITAVNVINMAQETSPTTPSTGTINNDGGSVTVGGEFNVGRNGGPGNVAVYNQSAGLLTTNGEIFVGRDSTMGTLSLTGGLAQVNSNLGIGMGGGSSNGTVNLDGVGTVMTVNGWTTLGRDTGGSPTLANMNVTNGALFQHLPTGGGDFLGGWQNGTNTTINVIGGGQMIQNWWFRLGIDPGSTSNMLVDGPGSSYTQDTGRIYVGEQGTASLTISTGATFTQTNGDQFNVGGNDGSSTGNGDGVLNISDGTVSTNNFIRVGFGNTAADPAVGVVNLTSGSLSAGGWIGFGHEGGNGVLNMSGGAITFGNEFYVGIDDNGHTRTTTGTATISGGSITQTGGGAGLFVGRSGGNGLLDILGIDPVAITITNEAHIGQGGVGAGGSAAVGVININNPAATISVTNGFYIGQDGGTGTVNQNTGTVNETNQWLTLAAGGGSTGTYNLGDGAVNANFMEVGADGIGTFNISGGTSTANQVTVGTRDTGVGVVNVSGGLFQSNGAIFLGGDQSGGSGTINSTGGITQAVFIEAHANGVGFLNMDGGTLRAGANEGNFLRNFNPANSEIGGGGLTIDSNAFSITAQNQFDGPGALTKVGAGTLKVTGDNLYSGGTSVTGGNLYVSNGAGSGTGSGDVTVTGATSVLGGFGTISGSVTASGSGSVAPGESTGVLSVGTNVTFSATSNLLIEINDAATPKNDTLNVTGTLDVTGAALVLNITGSPAEPFYIIANYGVLVGTFASATPPVGYTLDYAYGGNSIALVSSAADPYTTWIAGFATGGLDAKLDDADGDGVVNLLEFALGGSDPTNASATPDLVPGTETIGPDTYFTASTLMRVGGLAGVVGVGAPTNATAIDNLRYTVEGSVDLTTWATAMEPTTVPGTLPVAPAGWEWTTFRHVAPVASGDLSQARIRVASPF